jgi:hypothetical protein
MSLGLVEDVFVHFFIYRLLFLACIFVYSFFERNHIRTLRKKLQSVEENQEGKGWRHSIKQNKKLTMFALIFGSSV